MPLTILLFVRQYNFFSPISDEFRLDTNEYTQFLVYILTHYDLSWANIVCLIGEICNTNRSIVNLVNLPLINCASKRFQLALRDIMNNASELIHEVHKIMVKLRGLLLSAESRQFTVCGSKLSSQTRWSLTYEMLKRFVRICKFLPLLNQMRLIDFSIQSRKPTMGKDSKEIGSIGIG